MLYIYQCYMFTGTLLRVSFSPACNFFFCIDTLCVYVPLSVSVCVCTLCVRLPPFVLLCSRGGEVSKKRLFMIDELFFFPTFTLFVCLVCVLTFLPHKHIILIRHYAHSSRQLTFFCFRHMRIFSLLSYSIFVIVQQKLLLLFYIFPIKSLVNKHHARFFFSFPSLFPPPPFYR